jgi:hypothetical protein
VTGITWQLRAKDPDVACSQKMPYTLPTTRLLKKGIEKVCIEELTNLNPVEQRYSLSIHMAGTAFLKGVGYGRRYPSLP